MKITLINITPDYNRSIKYLLPFVNPSVEIILINTGNNHVRNTDAFKIFSKKFTNDFSILRNYAISKATGDWIFMLDSDEEIEKDDFEKIQQLIQSDEYDGYWFKRKWYIYENRYLQHGLFYPDYQLRLFRNNKKYKYMHRVHEELTIPLKMTKQTDVVINHYHSLYKYLSWKGYKDLDKYIELATQDFRSLGKSRVWYLAKSVYTFINMFFVALIRGKGVLDGWIGIKAHFFFALSISQAYWEAI